MKLLCDSDFLVALYRVEDSNHTKAINIYKRIEKKETLVALNIVFQESTTVVSKKMGMDHAKVFFSSINKLVNEVVILGSDLESATWKIFLRQTKKGTSFIDCANLAAYKKYKLDGILSFDDFYPKEVRAK